WVRYRVAFYASTPAYWPVLAPHGLEDLGAKLNAMTKAGQWDRIAAEVPDDVVHLFAAVGTHAEIAAAIGRRFGGVADGIYARAAEGDAALLPPGLLPDSHRIPSPFEGHRTSWSACPVRGATLAWASVHRPWGVVPGEAMETMPAPATFDLDAWVSRTGALELEGIPWED